MNHQPERIEESCMKTLWMFIQRLLGRSDVWFNGSRYMRRWLIGPRWAWGLRVHCIERSDADRELHDHPWWFVSIILRGGYWEHTLDGRRTWYGPGSIVFRSADTLHRIELDTECTQARKRGLHTGSCLSRPVPAWTLVLRGRRARAWGFLTADGWQHWVKFTRARDGQGVAAGQFAADSSL
jgi:hypothetical protein